LETSSEQRSGDTILSANQDTSGFVIFLAFSPQQFQKRGTNMRYRTLGFVLVGLLIDTSLASAGNIYKVTSQDGEKTITYEVRFGGGRLMDQFTGFDPETKKFVYLQWDRKGKPPTPAMKLWDHRTGETISLYSFPNAKNPLPVIPSIDAMKVCPLTNDKNFKATLHIIVD
jgi:hypothetical protein